MAVRYTRWEFRRKVRAIDMDLEENQENLMSEKRNSERKQRSAVGCH